MHVGTCGRTGLEERIGGLDGKYDSFINNLVSSGRERAIQDFEGDELSKILAGAQNVGSLDNTTSQLLLQRGKRRIYLLSLNAQEAETRFIGRTLNPNS